MNWLINKKIFFIILILLASESVYAQGILSGTIADSLTNDPIYGANIFLVNTSLGTASDITGKFRITNIPAGEHTNSCFLSRLLV